MISSDDNWWIALLIAGGLFLVMWLIFGSHRRGSGDGGAPYSSDSTGYGGDSGGECGSDGGGGDGGGD